MLKIVRVKSGMLGRIGTYNCKDVKVEVGDSCIVEVERGKDSGIVITEPEIIENFTASKDIKRLIRKANSEDLKKIEQNKKDAKDAFKKCQEKIEQSKLDMKLVDVEYIFDKSKIVCYFIADGRVDFRELVKDLANEFKIRIELRQIGVRDEAKILDGYGKCGQRLCCSNFTKDFQPVTIRMA